jgi:4-hydroxy-3-polyprenylbenzoate decarboxylase
MSGCGILYSKPKTIGDVAMTVVNRVIDLMGLENETYRWGAD